MRRYSMGLAVAAIGAGVGWLVYASSRHTLNLPTCSSRAAACDPNGGGYAIAPFDLTAAVASMIELALLAVVIVGVAWLVVSSVARSAQSSHRPIRRYLVGLAVAAIGATYGWMLYEGSFPRAMLATCSGGHRLAGTPPLCNPNPLQPVVPPFDLATAIVWMIAGAAIALAIAGLAWLAVSWVEGERRAHRLS